MIGPDQTAAWAATRTRFGFAEGNGQARTPLSAVGLGEDAVVMSVLTADPLRNDVDFSDDIVGVLPERFSGKTARSVSSLGRRSRSAGLVSTEAPNGDTTLARVGVRRDGGVEAAVGSAAFFSGRSGVARRCYRLFVLVHLVRQVVETQTRVVDVLGDADARGPYEMVMVIPGAGGAVLVGYAEGWSPPDELFGSDVPTAPPSVDPVVVLDVEEWPSNDASRAALIERFAERVCDAFGDDRRRFRVASGPGADRLDPGYA